MHELITKPLGFEVPLGANAGTEDGKGPPVLYKFHEGYTNAVKRPVFMKDLL